LTKAETMREALPVLYRDDRVVAVHKPSGLLVHRSMIDRHETRFALQIVRDQIGERVYPVHRLDKGTSGVLVFALDEAAARSLGSAFQNGEVEKRYLSVVRGWMPESGQIDHPLSRLDDAYGPKRSGGGSDRTILQSSEAIERGISHGNALDRSSTERVGRTPTIAAGIEPLATALPQAALTRYKRLACAEIDHPVEPRQRFPTTRYSLVELDPVTGRQHQLRRHLKHVAHPIIGDATYGKGVHNRFIAARFGASRLLLACRSINLPLPGDAGRIRIEAPLPDDFSRVLAGFGWLC